MEGHSTWAKPFDGSHIKLDNQKKVVVKIFEKNADKEFYITFYYIIWIIVKLSYSWKYKSIRTNFDFSLKNPSQY
jgi:hypothetical protein